jgi:hypothetical protein
MRTAANMGVLRGPTLIIISTKGLLVDEQLNLKDQQENKDTAPIDAQ